MDFKPTVRIFCEQDQEYSLSVRNGKVVLRLANPLDPFQHWIREEVDGGGFTLFNKGTAQAVSASPVIGPINTRAIDLHLISMPFGSHPDPHAVWTESKGEGNAFATVFQKQAGERQGFRLQPHSKYIFDKVIVLLSDHNIDSYQKWKFVPYHNDGVVCPKTIKIYCEENPNYNLTARDDNVVFAQSDRADIYQHWRKEFVHCQHLKDQHGFRAFSIVNVATGKAIQHKEAGDGYAVTLATFNPAQLDKSVLWTEGEDLGNGFKKIKAQNNVGVGLDVMYHSEWMSIGLQEGMFAGVWRDVNGASHKWKMKEFF